VHAGRSPARSEPKANGAEKLSYFFSSFGPRSSFNASEFMQ